MRELFFLFVLGWAAIHYPAHAETAAERIFGRWERVTPETILRPVPDWMPTGTPGAVTNEYRRSPDRTAKPGEPANNPSSQFPPALTASHRSAP